MKRFTICCFLVTTILILLSPVSLASSIVINIEDSGYSEVGEWAASGLKGYEDTPSRYSFSPNAISKWNPQFTEAATIKVSFYKLVHGTSQTVSYVDVVHNGQTDTITIDATRGYSDWVTLGVFEFSGTGDEYVALRSNGQGKEKCIRTNAVKFETVSSDEAQDLQYKLELEQKLSGAVALCIGKSTAYVNSEKIAIDVTPYVKDGRTMVPIRFIAESFDAEVEYENETQTISVYKKPNLVTMQLGNASVNINGVEINCDVAPELVNTSAFVPLRTIAEIFGKQVFWDDFSIVILSNIENIFDAVTDRQILDSMLPIFDEKVPLLTPKGNTNYFKNKDVVNTVDENNIDYMLEYKNNLEFNIRNGLSNSIIKLKSGEDVNIAYMGGSITGQNGWRPFSLNFIKKRYPNANIKEINAAIAGTGSVYGVARLQKNVLDFYPDILFIEFAVNDIGNSNEMKAIEGIVQKTWEKNPMTDIVFVYTLQSGQTAFYKEKSPLGLYSQSVNQYEQIAQHYGIPSIHFGYQVADMEVAGKLDFQGTEVSDGKLLFTKDGIHPLPAGAQLNAGAVARSLIKADGAVTETSAHKLIAPISENNWRMASLYDIPEAGLSGDWQLLTSDNSDVVGMQIAGTKKLYKLTKSGDTLSFKFEGTMVGLFDIGGPDSGQIEISIDGGEVKIYNRFESYNDHYRLQNILIQDLPQEEHTVTIKLSEQVSDKAEILTNKGDIEKNPDKYKDNVVYLGKIIMLGEMK